MPFSVPFSIIGAKLLIDEIYTFVGKVAEIQEWRRVEMLIPLHFHPLCIKQHNIIKVLRNLFDTQFNRDLVVYQMVEVIHCFIDCVYESHNFTNYSKTVYFPFPLISPNN